MIAALYVETNGIYFGLPGVDPWDVARDARSYAGPWPVVAHPPCERWGRYWNGGPSARVKRELGDDGGCFAAAYRAVQRFGGVLEHPEGSLAFREFRIHRPPKHGGWVRTSAREWVCCVEQGHYGHPARKATWLLVGAQEPPELIWGTSGQRLKLDHGYHSAEERRRAVKTGRCQRLSKKQCLATPEPFRDLLLRLAAMSRGDSRAKPKNLSRPA